MIMEILLLRKLNHATFFVELRKDGDEMLDVLIIGSGPAGLSAAIYAKRSGLEVIVIEKVYYGTGRVAESSRVDNYLGFAGINGYELGGSLGNMPSVWEWNFSREK